ncbi:MAG TPA: hypothetical protein ENN03_09625 [bacterium]|nr:hypothetical protein [bacterium]
MARVLKIFGTTLFSFVIAGTFLLTGCTRYANEEQLTTLDETEAAAVSAENMVEQKEKEKAALEQKLAEKQAELKEVQAEKAKVQSRLR